jgi:Flp pilus assembly protein TadG
VAEQSVTRLASLILKTPACTGMKQETAMLKRLLNGKRIRQFAKCTTGVVSIYTAVAAIPLMIGAGAAIDMARYNAAQTQVQAALDAAALAAAAAKGATDSERIAMAKASFDFNIKELASKDVTATPDFKVVSEKIVGRAKIEVPTTFMQFAGYSKLESTSGSEVGFASEKKAEIVLVLDYSWSMTEYAGSEIKYKAMRKASVDLVKDLSKTDPEKVKFGLVPYSHHVYTSLPAAYVVGGGGGTWTGCTVDRQYPYNTTSTTPSSSNATKWDPSIAPVAGAPGCGGYVSANLKTMDLTDNFNAVTNQLNIMKPYSYTHIALGVEFGYHMLSPNAPFNNGAAFGDKNVKKFMVVLTDGEQTEHGFGPGSTRSKEQGLTNLEALCTNAKADGITMITVAFNLGTGPTVTRLRNCASDPSANFFTPESAADLNNAFDSIKAAISAEVYISK